MTEKNRETVFKVIGMSCEHCKAVIESAIRRVNGVTDVQVDLKAGKAVVVGVASEQQIRAAVDDAGYQAQVQS